MRCICKYNQDRIAFWEGVCLSLSYFIIKRFLAGQHTSCSLVDGMAKQIKARQKKFARLAGEARSSDSIVVGFAFRDNLQTRTLDFGAHDHLREAISGIRNELQRIPGSRVGALICMSEMLPTGEGAEAGHAIAALFKKDQDQYGLFDPNYGLYLIEADGDLDRKPFSKYTSGEAEFFGGIWTADTAVMMTGASTDLAELLLGAGSVGGE